MSASLRASAYRRRVVDAELDELLAGASAVALEGLKGVGKSATAAERARTEYLLEQPATREVLAAAPERILEDGPVLLDEWQYLPEIWDTVRRAVDRGASPGQFLLTGSASAPNPGTHTGAGRIVTVRLRPLGLGERGVSEPSVSLATLLSGSKPAIGGATPIGLVEYVDQITESGLPGIRGLHEEVRRRMLHGYVDRIIDRDFPELGHPVRNPAALRRWLTAYAAATATTASYEAIRDASTSGEGDKPAKTTTVPYRDVLERLYVLDPVPAWLPTRNHLRRLGVAPKHHLADPALAITLLGLGPSALLDGEEGAVSIPRDGTFLGAVFESLVALHVRVYAQAATARTSHCRTHRGEHEVDLIVEREDGRVVAVETKVASSVSDSDVRHLLWLREELGPDLLDCMIITTGSDAYRRADGVAVVPLALLGP